ncbi:hypothetical protein LOD99_5256 [Oopsacas minuta]|uniref:Uncharacterized protein n=1 Tax=Oopsacas minuta TaxID=111878 RepID=A0AAV7JRE0_9METZ|nr:hypothetical protein LOD99_5256 [Oopsacas minuta]
MNGASVMSSHVSDVQARLKDKYPWLVHIHCTAHWVDKTSCRNRLPPLTHNTHFLSKLNITISLKNDQMILDETIQMIPQSLDVRCPSCFDLVDTEYDS